MTDANAFTKLVPGFDFLQGLVKNAGAALPGIGQWVAPTLNPEEIEKRIEELRTVQFWLEQNARMLGATIQALEVQRMTLSTLKSMNVQMSDLRDSMRLRDPSTAQAFASSPAAASKAASHKTNAGSGSADPALPAGVVDPMQWWGALTKQFTQLAAGALKDSATDTAKNLAGAMVKQGFDAAEQTLKSAVAAPMKAASGMARAAGGMAGAARAAKGGRAARTAESLKAAQATDAGSTSGGAKPGAGSRGRGARKATG